MARIFRMKVKAKKMNILVMRIQVLVKRKEKGYCKKIIIFVLFVCMLSRALMRPDDKSSYGKRGSM